MSTAIPALTTERLLVRPFTMGDLHSAHHVLSEAWSEPHEERDTRLAAREEWLRWSIASYEQLAGLFQFPYGDRAVVRKADGRLLGSVGLVPVVAPFRQIPDFPEYDGSGRWYSEVGLFWAIDPAEQGQGYATEAARALIARAIEQLQLARVIATTGHGNAGSIGVMRKLGMRILRNPLPAPAWLQVVGLLE